MQNLSLRMINRGKVTGEYRIVAGHALFFCFTGSCGLLGRHAVSWVVTQRREKRCVTITRSAKNALKMDYAALFFFMFFFPLA